MKTKMFLLLMLIPRAAFADSQAGIKIETKNEVLDSAVISDEQLRCNRALDIGTREGAIVFRTALGADSQETICFETKQSSDNYWLRAHTMKNYLWDLEKFKPLAGLEDFQECRIQGQNEAIEAAHETILKECLNETVEVTN